MKKNILIVAFIAGLLLRLALGLNDSYGDIDASFIPWTKDARQYGLSGLYERNPDFIGAIYPPVTMFLFLPAYQIGAAIAPSAIDLLWQINQRFPIFPSKIMLIVDQHKILSSMMKLPAMIGDIFLSLGILFLAGKLVKRKNSPWPVILSLSMLFNPALIFNSSIWGQVDTLPLAFAVWSFYFLYEKKYLTSAILFTLGQLSKQTIVVILPVYALLFLTSAGWKNIGRSVIAAIVIFFLLYLPFYRSGNILFFPFASYLRTAGHFFGDWLSAGAFNFWQFINLHRLPDTLLVLNLFPIGTLVRILTVVFIIFILLMLVRKKYDFKYGLLAVGIICLFVFLFMSRMHERYLLPALPFLLLASVIDTRIYWIFVLTSFFHLFNLYFAWNRPPVDWLIAATVNKPFVNALIVIQVVLFICLTAYFIRQSPPKKKTAYQKNNR